MGGAVSADGDAERAGRGILRWGVLGYQQRIICWEYGATGLQARDLGEEIPLAFDARLWELIQADLERHR